MHSTWLVFGAMGPEQSNSDKLSLKLMNTEFYSSGWSR